MLYNTCQPVRLPSSSHQEAGLNPKYCFEKQNFRGDQAKEFCTTFCFNLVSETVRSAVTHLQLNLYNLVFTQD